MRIQQKHEAYMISSTEAEDDDWIGRVTDEFEDTQCVVDKYFDELCKEDTKIDLKSIAEKTSISALKTLEIQRRQEDIRFKGVCEQLTSLICTKEEDAKNVIEAIKDFTLRVVESKERMDRLCNEFIEASVMESKDVPQSVDDMVSHIGRQFNKLYTDARIFISKFDLSKLDIEKQRKKDSGGIRLEKVKFNMVSGDIRKYPCFLERIYSAH